MLQKFVDKLKKGEIMTHKIMDKQIPHISQHL